jgi:hypothetical protein
MVKPFRVKESPAQLECKVINVMPLGDKGGAGNLIICEIVLMHINEEVLDANKQIDPRKIDLVARLGANWYSRTNGDALFEVAKPLLNLGIGVDQLPESIRFSEVLSGNNLGQLGNVEHLPTAQDVIAYKNESSIKLVFEKYDNNKEELKMQLHSMAKKLLDKGNVEEAWKILLAVNH